MLDNIFRYLDLYLSSFSKFISVFGICSGVLLSFINVILRYIFNMSITWAAELSIYLFMASALLSSSLGFIVIKVLCGYTFIEVRRLL